MSLSMFELLCYAEKLPKPVAEFRFAPPRRFRYDFWWPKFRVAVEIEGGIFMRGGSRHTRGKGFLADIEKYNLGTAMGHRIFRATPSTLHLLTPFLKEVLAEAKP